MADEIVWNGPDALRPFLVAIDTLEPFPNNPRRGDVRQLRASLRRFGQVLPALVDPALGADGQPRIVARHHIILAAAEEGWTHVAAIPNDFADEEEARAYLVADNHLPELGGYDLQHLTDHLRELAELDALDGTGYSRDDVDDRLAELAALRESAQPQRPAVPPREPRAEGDLVEVVLLYNRDQRDQFEGWAKIVAHERGTSGVSETVYEAMELAARQLNA